MSTALNFTGNSEPPPNRRLYPRHPVSALAYLDIGTENGGIVLNLSEDGMGFQAVAPLDGQAAVSLRIQLPHTQERIETGAKVVWLDASNRHAGVQFFDMAPEGRAQIRRWLASQGSTNSAPTIGANLEPIPSTSVGHAQPSSEPIGDPRNDKWLSLMADFVRPAASASAEADPGVKPKKGLEQKIAPPIPESSGKKTLSGMLNPFRQREAYNAEARVNETTRPGAPDAGSGETDPLIRPAGVPNASSGTGSDVPRRKSDGHSVLDFPVREPGVAPSILSEVLAEDPNPTAGSSLLATQAHLAPAVEAIIANTRPLLTNQAAAIARRTRLRKMGAVAVLFIVFSFLCYNIGTRVGALRSEEHPVETAPVTTPSTAAGSAVAANSGVGSNEELVTKTEAAPPAKTQAAASKRNSQITNRKLEPPLNVSLPAPASRMALQPTVTQQAVPAPSSSKPAENVASLGPLTSDAPTNLEPKMIGGRALRPTDRFNPCHLTYRVEPAYPLEAQQQHIEGSVKIHQVIGADGTVEDVRFVSGPAPLASAAMDAAKYWRYLPALLNGQPVETEQDVQIDFHLPH